MKRLALLFIGSVFFPHTAFADCQLVEFGNTSNIIRAKITDSTTGNGKTGLLFSSTGLRISTIADIEATATSYTSGGSTTETITTLGTFAAPTATKVRFKEVDATNHPGLYEFQIADARFAVTSAKSLILSASGVSGMQDMDCNIPLVHPPSDFWTVPTFAELSAVPGTTPTAAQMVQWVYQMMKFKLTQTSTTSTAYKADSSTSLGTSATSDNGTTFSRGKYN